MDNIIAYGGEPDFFLCGTFENKNINRLFRYDLLNEKYFSFEKNNLSTVDENFYDELYIQIKKQKGISKNHFENILKKIVLDKCDNNTEASNNIIVGHTDFYDKLEIYENKCTWSGLFKI